MGEGATPPFQKRKGDISMRSKKSRLALFGVLALALSVTAGITVEGAAAKKKKVKTFSEQVTPNAAIPEDAAAGPSVPVISEIKVPKKKYKKSLVGDVNVTNLQTSGSSAGAASDLYAELTAPNGRTVLLFAAVGDIQAPHAYAAASGASSKLHE